MGAMDTLHLRWDEYESNVKCGFSKLREDEDFYDVTLACGENQIKAHKVILGACSSFFKSLIKSVPHQHPLLYLSGIDFGHLESVLSFMYHGEVRIKSNDVEKFLAVAQELKVNGLTRDQPCSSSFSSMKEERIRSNQEETHAKQMKRKPSTEESTAKRKIFSIEEPKIEDIISEDDISITQEDCSPLDQDDMTEEDNIDEDPLSLSLDKRDMYQKLDARLMEYISPRDSDKKYGCLKCSYKCHSRKNVMYHVEGRHLLTSGFTCEKCGRVYKTRKTLRSHKARCHKNDKEFFDTRVR